MKRCLALLLVIVIIAHTGICAAEDSSNWFDSAGKFFGDAWDKAGDAVENAWEATTDAVGSAWDATTNALSNAWNATSNAVVKAWNDAGVYLGEKSDQFSVWMNINGYDALEKLKVAFDELLEEMQIGKARANEIWLQVMDYAESYGIAKVTQAKLTLAAFAYTHAENADEDAIAQALDMLLNSGITDQSAAEAALGVLVDGSNGEQVAIESNTTKYYMGEVVNTGTDNGYSKSEKIDRNDLHFGWQLGRFFVSGYTRVTEDDEGDPVFLKNVGDKVTLWFNLAQDIDCLNGDDDLTVVEDENGSDEYFGIDRTNFGRGTLIVRYTDYQNATQKPVIYTDYLAGNVAVGADTTVQLFEEGDYEIALNYEVRSKRFVDKVENYRISFKFSVRNGNCMVYPIDTLTNAELSNTAITPNGFRLDLARSRYLDINIKRETLTEGAVGLTEDIRFNRPAKDGDQYTAEGIYTITVINRYTQQTTTKQIYVGTDDILRAHVTTGLSIEEIRKLILEGAVVNEDGTVSVHGR